MKSIILALPMAVASLAFDKAPSQVDVESAAVKELSSLKGVGPATANAIIDYRKKMRAANTKSGKKTWNFHNWATLMKVNGVGPQICQDNIETTCSKGKIQKKRP